MKEGMEVLKAEKQEVEHRRPGPDPPLASVTGCITIDNNTTNDNGFLVCARQGHPGAGGHGSTSQAVDNLLNCLSSSKERESAGVRTVNIVGHGDNGLIVTGSGQIITTNDKLIAWYDYNSWRADLARLNGKISLLKLVTCHAGAGTEGVDLLNKLCQVTGATCMGATGFTYCSGSDFPIQNGATWQVVSPGQPLPQPINPPSAKEQRIVHTMRIITPTEPSFEDISSDKIKKIVIEMSTPDNQKIERVLNGDSVNNLFEVIDFSSPFVTPVVGSIAIGSIEIHFKDLTSSNIPATKKFNILPHKRLEDVDKIDQDKGTYYAIIGDLSTLHSMKIKSKVDKVYYNVPLENIRKVEILSPDKKDSKRSLQEKEVANLLNVINFNSPFDIEGKLKPAAIITGYIRVHFIEPAVSKISPTRDFIIWNDKMLEDEEVEGHFFDVIGNLKELLHILLR